jgi:hypothetical protein
MIAYNHKNLDMYKACLDADFRFHVLSDQVPVIGESWWGYEQEIEFHRNLFSLGSSDGSYPPPSMIHLNLQIPLPDEWQNDYQVGHENWVIISCFFDLKLSFTNRNDISSSGFARFHLKPVDGKWYIAIWIDESHI